MENLKKTKWLEEDRICIAMGNPVARNRMFENQKDQQLFLTLWNKYLGDMTEIITYRMSTKGWCVLFKTKTKIQIIDAYQIQRKKSKKAKKAHQIKDTSKILSEHFRIFLSQYARRMNARNQRKGTLVLERFKKFVLKKYVDYIEVFEKITKGYEQEAQRLEKYRTPLWEDTSTLCEIKKRQMISKIVKKDSILNSSNLWILLNEGLDSFNDVLRKYFPSKIYAPKSPNSS